MADAIVSGKKIPDYVRLRQVSYTYPSGRGQQVLHDVDLGVRPEEYLLVCGASGSGKSTLVRTFNGLIPHFYGGRINGDIVIAGNTSAGTTVSELFDKVGLVFQNPRAQLFNRTVTQELAFGMESLGLPRVQMAARIRTVSSDLGMDDLLPRNPQFLSGGEQQMVALAAVLVLEPRIVVLDEPLANLDAAHVRRLRTLLRHLRSRGTGIVVCEHRMAPTLPDADRLALIHDGALVREGRPQAILTNPSWKDCGVELPLAVRLGIRNKLSPLPLDMPALLEANPSRDNGHGCQHQRQFPPAPGDAVLRAENVSHAIEGKPVLANIDLSLHKGQCTALVGANGAGKTTLLRLFSGLLRPASGRILLGKTDLAELPPWEIAKSLGTAFQNPNSQFFKMTVREEILVGPKTLDRYDADWFRELVALFRLEHLLDRAPFKLSGGEKKRVAFASALAAKPEILTLDEPTAGQDSLFREALAQILDRLTRQGTAVLVVTHALNFAQRLSSRWIVMESGRIIGRGDPDTLMADGAMMQKAGLEPTETFLWRQACRD